MKIRFNFIQVLLAMIPLFLSCAENSGARFIRISSYNAQTFFDAQCDGSEYSNFVKAAKKGSWNEKLYLQRLERLCELISALDSEVLVLQEIESEAVLRDIFNALEGKIRPDKAYRYGCFARGTGAIGCAVLSRHPLEGMSVHALDVRAESERMPPMRPVIQVTVLKDGFPLSLEAVHWKSKSGGKERSEVWRNWQERLLERLLLECGGAALACGDFNRDLCDFRREEPGRILLGGTQVDSGWTNSDGSLAEPGSYFFRDEWERIDHFFSRNISIEEFRVESEGPWAKDGRPDAFAIWSGGGFSDHFPISCRLAIPSGEE